MNAHRYVLDCAKNRHPPIVDLVQENGVLGHDQLAEADLFDFMARTVVGQQLSNAAARTIWQRLEDLSKSEGVNVRQLMSPRYIGKVPACGISKGKVKALSKLNSAFDDKAINLGALHGADYGQVVEIITSLWGFGQWSADMIAMFYLQMPDVWPEQDAALARGLQILFPDEDSSEIAEFYAPERTYLARHIWIGLDTGRIKM